MLLVSWVSHVSDSRPLGLVVSVPLLLHSWPCWKPPCISLHHSLPFPALLWISFSRSTQLAATPPLPVCAEYFPQHRRFSHAHHCAHTSSRLLGAGWKPLYSGPPSMCGTRGTDVLIINGIQGLAQQAGGKAAECVHLCSE